MGLGQYVYSDEVDWDLGKSDGRKMGLGEGSDGKNGNYTM